MPIDQPNLDDTIQSGDVGHNLSHQKIHALLNQLVTLLGTDLPENLTTDLSTDLTGVQSSLAGKATPSDIATAIADLVDSSPATLDTLNELATALGDDPDFATTVTNALAAKQPAAQVLTDTTAAFTTEQQAKLAAFEVATEADQILYADTLTGTGPLGSPWVDVVAGVERSANGALSPSSAALSTIDVGSPLTRIDVSNAPQGNNTFQSRLIFSYVDEQNYAAVRIQFSAVSIVQVIGGVETALSNVNWPTAGFAVNNWRRVFIRLTERSGLYYATCWLDHQPDKVASAQFDSSLGLSTKIGMLFQAAGETPFRNLVVREGVL